LPILFSIIAATSAAFVQAQDDTLPPPQVIDVWPLPGVEMTASEPLTISFDQPMDPAATAAAFSLLPEVSGSTTWLDARTLRFTPDARWPRETDIVATVSTNAQSAGGVALGSAFQAQLETVGPLEVGSVAPDGEAAAADDARIVVTFNRPVVALGSTADMAALPSPIEVSPAIEGSGEWVNTSIYAFTPSSALAGSTTYTVSVLPGLESVDGAVLSEGYTWQFRTLPPEILSVTPSAGQTSVPLDTTFTVQFSQPMDPESVEIAFTLSDESGVALGSFSWNEDHTVVTFTPLDPLAMETEYRATVATTATSANGESALDEPYSIAFTTQPYPRVTRTNPDPGESGMDPTWLSPSIQFSTPVTLESVQSRIHISPEPDSWSPQINEWEPSRVTLMFSPSALTTYTIRIDAGIEDPQGHVMAEPYAFSFTTGELTPQAYPIINGNFVITNADREDTRLAMLTSGRGEYWIDVYKLTPEQVSNITAGYFDDYSGSASFIETFEDSLPYWVDPSTEVRSLSVDFNTQGEQRVPQEVLLASDDGGQLPPGLYWTRVFTSAPSAMFGMNSFQFALAVVNSNLTVKRGPETTLVWLTDLDTGTPVANARVTIYQAKEDILDETEAGLVLATGQTGADGSLVLPVDLPQDSDSVYVIAEGEGVYGAWYSNHDLVLPTERGYLYTDRPIYRPGETVYFRGVLRDRHDMDFSVPQENTVHVRVQHPWQTDQVYAEMDLPVTEFGSFSGEYSIPLDAEIGDMDIAVDFGDGVSYEYGYLNLPWTASRRTTATFTVAEFRPPEIEVGVTAQAESIIQGEPVAALAAATYYAGGSVNNASVTYSVYGSATSFAYTGPGRYNFVDSSEDSYYYESLASGENATDEQGRLLISTDQTIAPSIRPMNIMVEATVMDEASQPVSSHTTVLAHPANLYVGVGSESIFLQTGEAAPIRLLTVTPDSVPVASQPVDIQIEEVEWKRIALTGQPGRATWQEETTLVATDRVISGADGTVSTSFTPASSGRYRITASVRDAQERVNKASITLYVTGEEPIFWSEPSSLLALQADKTSYQPGDVANILIPLPADEHWTLLVTAERAGVMTHEVVEADGTTLMYALPLDESFVPTVYVSITALRGATAADANPAYATGQLRLAVEPVNQRLDIEAVPSTELAAPRETISFDLTATDANGDPVQAEIGLALVDKSVLALMPPNSTTLEETFYGEQRNYVITEVAMSGLIDLLTDAVFPSGRGGGGGGGGEAAFIRDDFEFTPLWAPHVVTDANGQATVSVTLPDNLTTWQLDARAVTTTTEVGQTTTEILSTLPLRVRPVAPRFFVAGDRAQVGVIVNNNTGSVQTVEVHLEASGVTLESDATQTVTIESGSRLRVDWTVIAQDVPGVDLVFSAVSDQGYQDAARPLLTTGPDNTIPVYVYSAPDTTGTGGILRDGGSATETISLPTRLAGAGGELQINLDPSLASALTDALDVQENTTCQCTEATVSKLLSNAITYGALGSLGIANAELEGQLTTEISTAIDELLASQKPDGSWSWVQGVETGDPLVTAYAALALTEAEEAGFTQLRSAINNAVGFVQLNLPGVNNTAAPWQLNRAAFYLYVMSRAGYGDVPAFNALMAERLRLSYAARAYLLMSLADRPGDPARATLQGDLTSAAILSATGAHWEEPNPDWYNWGSDTRTTALVLNALITADPNNELLPNGVRWLMTARRGDHWVTTQEMAWSVQALAHWMRVTGELNADYGYEARLNGSPLAEAQVTAATVDDGQALRVSVANLLRDEANRLTVVRTEGDGALYYSAFLDLTLPASEVQALSRGITVEREYYLNGDRSQPTTEAQVGDVITVRVTLTLPQDIPYFAFEDPIPAGTESIDPSLETTSVSAQSPRLAMPLKDDPYWFFGWWWFDRTELRDAQTRLYADFLPRGTYIYTYQLRATLAGEFNVMPAHAFALYQPDVFGRTDGSRFTILPGDEAVTE
jgi:uncharacterized protein YfaS (alpha-2-macroglobulin family)